MIATLRWVPLPLLLALEGVVPANADDEVEAEFEVEVVDEVMVVADEEPAPDSGGVCVEDEVCALING